MNVSLEQKSSIAEIENRFDNEVERFSNLETGQIATVDAPSAMELITQAAFHATKNIQHVLDIGSGAGNNTLKFLQYASPFDSDLVDLSLPVLKKAHERISSINTGTVTIHHGDYGSEYH